MSARAWIAVAVALGACAKKSTPAKHDAGAAARVALDAAPAGPPPQVLAPPADGTTRLALDRLVLDVKGRWETSLQAEGLSASPEGVDDAAVLVMPSIDLAGASLGDVLVRGIEASTNGHTVVKEKPVQLGASKTGVAFAGKIRVTRGPGGETLNALYYIFDVGGRGQVVALLATTAAGFKAASSQFAPALDAVQVITAAAAPAMSEFSTTAVGSTAYVASVGESPALTPVTFRIAWAQRNERRSAYTTFGFHFARDGQRSAYVYDGEEYDAVRTDAVFRYAGGAARAQTPIDHKAFEAAVLEATKFRDADGYPLRVSELESLDANLAGDLFVGGRAAIFGDAFKGYSSHFVWRRGAGKPEPIAADLTFEQGWSWQATSYLRPTPQGDAWLFLVRPGNWPRVVYLSHAAGAWQQRELDISRFSGGGQGPTPTVETLTSWGAPDFTGGWVFYSNGAFWRISRDGGAITPVVRMELPTKGVTLSGPVVLENGDIWFAALTDSSVVSYVGPDQWGHGTDQVRHQSIVLGDRARWIRARLDGKGGVVLGEISGEAILAALRAAGAELDGGVFETPVLKLDLATGGLLTYDTHHGVLYAVEPLD